MAIQQGHHHSELMYKLHKLTQPLYVLHVHLLLTFALLAMMQLLLQSFADAMKNLSLMGAMVLILANGAGAWSIDQCCCRPKPQVPTNETK